MEIHGSRVKRVMSASTLKGDKVINPEGEDLGKVEEFMIDLETGCIAYAVLSFGGIMGMGDKLFAIPMQALTLHEDKKAFILNVPKEKLKKASGFDKHHWPDMATSDFMSETYSFFGYEPHSKEK